MYGKTTNSSGRRAVKISDFGGYSVDPNDRFAPEVSTMPGRVNPENPKTMRQLAETLQRPPEVVDPVAPGAIPGGAEGILSALEEQAERLKAEREEADPAEAGEHEINGAFLESLLAEDPYLVIIKLIEYLRARG